MKIKLSKSQWENMGKEAGWMKISTLQTKNQTQQNELLSAVDRMVARLNDLKGYISSGQVSFNNIHQVAGIPKELAQYLVTDSTKSYGPETQPQQPQQQQA